MDHQIIKVRLSEGTVIQVMNAEDRRVYEIRPDHRTGVQIQQGKDNLSNDELHTFLEVINL